MKRLHYKIFILCFSGLIFCGGCATGKGRLFSKKENFKEPEPEYSSVVLRPSFLKKEGAGLIVVPFTAGVGVEANKDLDRLSLMIVKGVIDTLNKDGVHFKILSSQEADKADFIIQGHIIHRVNPQAHRGWMFRPRDAVLSVESKMTERKSGNLILIYSRERKVKFLENGTEDETALARHLGQDIAEYILEQVK